MTKTGDHDRRADRGGLICKELCPHPLDCRELGAVGEVCGYRDNIFACAANRTQQCDDVLKTLPGLLFDITLADNLLIFVPCDLAGEMNDVSIMLDHAHVKAAVSWGPDAAFVETLGHTSISDNRSQAGSVKTGILTLG